MADIINATIDDKQFEVYVRMNLIGALFEPEENLNSASPRHKTRKRTLPSRTKMDFKEAQIKKRQNGFGFA